MLVVGRRLVRGLLKTKLGEAIAELRKSGASDERIAIEENMYEVELGENIGPITEFGKTYNRTQLYHLFRYVGKYFLGLPAFGPNILRSMHVTAVLIKAIAQGKKYDDPEVKDIFALARHGQFYREKTYNMVKADLKTARGKTFMGQNHGLSGTIGEDGDDDFSEATGHIESCQSFLELFEWEGTKAFSTTQREQAGTSLPPFLQMLFGPQGMVGFMQQLCVLMRGATDPDLIHVDKHPAYLANKERLRDLNIEIEREEIQERIRERERRLAELKRLNSTEAVTGQKRPATSFAGKAGVATKRERLKRSTDGSDADKLEILRAMHTRYIEEVEKKCILPDLGKLSKKMKSKLVDEDPQKVLKGKLRRGKPSILCVPEVGEFLRGFDEGLWCRFVEAFGGTGQNITTLLRRVEKNKELPSFVWKDAVLSKCGEEECLYCD